MGVKDLIKNKEKEEDKAYKIKIKNHLDNIGGNPEDKKKYSSAKNGNDLSTWEKIKEFLGFHLSARIVYVILLCMIIGALIPLILYWVGHLDYGIKEPYGQCMIKPQFRFQCLINSPLKEIDETLCINSNCCFDTSRDLGLPFRCYHSVPSAFQYKALGVPPPGGAPGDINLDLQANQGILQNIKLVATCLDPLEKHLRIQLTPGDASKTIENKVIGRDLTCGDLKVVIEEVKERFNLRITRPNDETIFDLQLGPLAFSQSEFTITNWLPTRHFFGLKVLGPGNLNSSIVIGLNKFGNQEFPFYMPLEKDGNVHGVFIDTEYPFIAQTTEAPGILFNFEKPSNSGISLHIFGGPSPSDVARQLGRWKNGVNPPYFPPHYGLGLHFCRKSTNSETSFAQITQITNLGVPFDTDCLDEGLMGFADLSANFPNDTLKEIEEFLSANGRRILLSQTILIPADFQEIGPEFLVKDALGEPFLGNNGTVKYLDVFHEQIGSIIENIVLNTSSTLPFENILGFFMGDNFPLNSYDKFICSHESKIWSGENDIKVGAFKQGTLCPELAHAGGGGIHRNLHNLYGHTIFDLFTQAHGGIINERRLFLSSSVSTESSKVGGHSGKQVPFTWSGMRDSLEHILRNFLFLPFSGTPICGTYLTPGSLVDEAEELCNRWFQLGLLLPFARNSYGGAVNSTLTLGILDLSSNLQGYLINQIKERYSLIPYYYTGLYKYNVDFNPLITPLAFAFPHHNETYGIYSQFMIGDGLMVVPILNPGTSRDAYFPRGVTWYEMNGRLVEASGFTSVQALNNQYPLYIRTGTIIPQIKPAGSTAQETLQTGNYSLLVTFPKDFEGQISTGALFIDDGITPNTISDKKYNFLEFTCTPNSLSIITSQCTAELPDPKFISEIRIFGFESQPSALNSTLGFISDEYDTEERILLLPKLNINICQEPEIWFYWTL